MSLNMDETRPGNSPCPAIGRVDGDSYHPPSCSSVTPAYLLTNFTVDMADIWTYVTQNIVVISVRIGKIERFEYG